MKGEKEDESGGSISSNSRVSAISQSETVIIISTFPPPYQNNIQGEPPAKKPRQHSQGPNLLVRGGGRVNNQSKQKQVVVGEESEEEKKSAADGEMSLPVDEPVVEEGPVEPEAQEVKLGVFVSALNPFNRDSQTHFFYQRFPLFLQTREWPFPAN